VHAKQQLDAVAAQLFTEGFSQWRGLAGQHVPGGLNESNLAAQAAQRLSHLGANRPAAENQQAARDGFHAGHLAVGPHTFQLTQARDWRHDRFGTGRQDDVAGRAAHAADFDHARPGQPAGAADQVDALAR
jgi:hypothetical protein